MRTRFLIKIALLGVFCLSLAMSAHAAELFIKKNRETIPPSPVPPPHEQTTEGQAAPVPEVKTPESIDAFAEKYYNTCMSKKDDVLKGKPQKMLCACSSANMAEKMTVEEVRAMATDTAEGLRQRNRMLLEVYAPCMEYPTQALLNHRCLNDPNMKASITNTEEVCGCLADNIAQYVKANGPQTLAKALKDDPKNLDPMASLMNSPEFQHQSQTVLMNCITQHQPQTTGQP